MPLPIIMFLIKLTPGSDSAEIAKNGHVCLNEADKRYMSTAASFWGTKQTDEVRWAMQLRGISTAEPGRLVKMLTSAILACGGWVLSRGARDSGVVDFLFEFERQACVDIYAVLISVGIELSPIGHLRFTELCHCTGHIPQDCRQEIVSIDLEIWMGRYTEQGIGNRE